MEEKPDPKPYSLQWFLQELVKAVFIAAAMLILSIAGMGILQAYLLPERMDQESVKIQKKFDDQIAQLRTLADSRRNEAVKREAELISQLEELKREYLADLVQAHPDNQGLAAQLKAIDPERSRREWVEKHSVKF